MKGVFLASAALLSLALVQPSAAQTAVAQWVEHLAFNVTAAPLDNTTLRQAIAAAIDRRAVLESARPKFPPGWSSPGPAGSWFPPNLPQHSPDVLIHPYSGDTARELLAKSGFPGGNGLPEFELLYRADFPFRRPEAELFRSSTTMRRLDEVRTFLPLPGVLP